MLILGHRGAVLAPLFPENSLQAFRYALAYGDGYETDAVLDPAGAIRLAHDPRNIPPDAPRLDECLAQLGGKTINIELKGEGVATPVINLLRNALADGVIAPERVVVSSFRHAWLPQVRQAVPAIAIGALTEKPSAAFWASPLLAALKPEWVVMPETELTAKAVADAAQYLPGARLAGWTVSEKRATPVESLVERLKTLPKAAVAAMIVDDPQAFAAAWKTR